MYRELEVDHTGPSFWELDQALANVKGTWRGERITGDRNDIRLTENKICNIGLLSLTSVKHTNIRALFEGKQMVNRSVRGRYHVLMSSRPKLPGRATEEVAMKAYCVKKALSQHTFETI